MKVHHITEAPKTSVGDRKEPKLNIGSGSTTSSDGKPLKGQSLKLNGVNYQWKGANWIVTDTSEFKGKNPPKKGAIADRNARALLNQQAASLNGGSTPKKVDPPKAVSSNIDGGGEDELKSKLKADKKAEAAQKKASKGFFRKWVGGIVKYFSIGVLGNAIQVALNVPQLEDAFDAYLRSLANAGMTDPTKCRTIGQIKKGNPHGSPIPKEVVDSYTRVTELTAELIIEGIVGAFSALSTPIAYALAAALFVKLGIVSGGVTVVLSLIAGGAWIIGGPALIRSCFDALGVMNKIENFIADKFLGLEASCRWANAIDALQKLGNIPGQVITPNLFGESEEIVKEKSSSAIKSDLEKIIKSDPKILASYKKGKKLKPKFDAKLKAN